MKIKDLPDKKIADTLGVTLDDLISK